MPSGALMVLQDRRNDSRKCDPRRVERMHNSRLSASGWTIADVRAPPLEILEVARR